MQFNLADLFECVADHVSDREAVVCGDRRVTYRDLDDRSTRAAHALLEAGVAVGDHVGLYLRNSVAHLEAMLGCFKARAVPINVNTRYVDDELAYLFGDADLVALVYDGEFAATVDAVRSRVPALKALFEVGSFAGTFASDARDYEHAIASASAARDFGDRSAGDHYVLYTGGTTGLPKGVVWRQDDIFFAALGGGNPGGPAITRPEEIGPAVVANPAQRVAAFLPPGHARPSQFVSLGLGPLMHASGQWSVLGALLGGGLAVLYHEAQMDARLVLELIEREGVIACNLVGDASARPLLDVLDSEGGTYDTSSLLLIGSGGSILSGDLKTRLLDSFPSVLAIIEGIGSSESPAQGVALTTRDGRVPESLRFTARETTMVVDDDLRPIARGSGIVGRLATRGHVPLGYYKDPEKSARTFVEIDGARWSLPGDMATIDADGVINLLGRGAMCINTGGEKVYPEEVEAALKAHPLVVDAVVVGAPDDRWGERVAAIVQPAPGAVATGPTLKDLQDHCRGRLAGYKVPRALFVVERVERTGVGKPDYAWARSIVAGGAASA